MARWFRFYNEALDDPKVQRLAPEVFKAWVNILCLAARGDGKLPSVRDISFALRLSEAKTDGIIKALKSAELIDGETEMEPHGWRSRQYDSDVSTPRVKRFRERFSNGDGTVKETPSETDSETDTEQKQINISSAPKISLQADFDAWWDQYPRKRGKNAALKAYMAARRADGGPSALTLMNGAMRYAAERTGQDGKFTAHPATWLNQGRWDDEPEKPHEPAKQRYAAPSEAERRAGIARGVAAFRAAGSADPTGQGSSNPGSPSGNRASVNPVQPGADSHRDRQTEPLGGGVQGADGGFCLDNGILRGRFARHPDGPVVDGLPTRQSESPDRDEAAFGERNQGPGGLRGPTPPHSEIEVSLGSTVSYRTAPGSPGIEADAGGNLEADGDAPRRLKLVS